MKNTDYAENINIVGTQENESNHVSTNSSNATSEPMVIESPVVKNSFESISTTSDDNKTTVQLKGKYSRLIVDSDSDVDDITPDTISQTVSGNKDYNLDNNIDDGKTSSMTRRLATILDSDSDDDGPSLVINDFQTVDNNSQKKTKTFKSKAKAFSVTLNSDSDDDINEPVENDSGNDVLLSKNNTKKFSTLIDSESEEDTAKRPTNYSSTEDNNDNNLTTEKSKKKIKKQKTNKKRTGSERAAKDEAMRQIHSETQRLARETPVSLPYHRPKQRTLQEFLNRKKIEPDFSQISSTATKLRKSIAVVSQAMEEKEKEAELFYKSSDSEDETSTVTVKPLKPEKKINEPSSIVTEYMSIEETQKINKIDVKNAQNKKQIIQQTALEIGVPRKLFLEDANDPFKVDFSDTPAVIDVNVENVKIPHKEFKEGLKEVSVPRKLFDMNFEDPSTPMPKHDILSQESTSNTDDILTPGDKDKTINYAEEILTISSDTPPAEDNQKNCNYLSREISGVHEILSQNEFIDLTGTQSSKSTGSSSVDCPIMETPVLSNEEFYKLNHRHLLGKPTNSTVKTTNVAETTEVKRLTLGRSPSFMDSDTDDIKETPKTAGLIIKKSELVNVPVKIKLRGPSVPTHMTLGRSPSFMDSDWEGDDKMDAPKAPLMAIKKPLFNIPNVIPKLRGKPGMIIDLNEQVKPNKAAVNNFFDRFVSKHSVTTKPTESNAEVTVTHTERTSFGVKVTQEILPYKNTSKIDDAELNKPGGKFRRLKANLKQEMAKKRNDEWKQKELDLMMDEEEKENDQDVACKKKEKELLDSSEGETEPEEEDDIPINDKERKTCDFGDDEAEVSEVDEVELSEDEEDVEAEVSEEDDEVEDDVDEHEDESDITVEKPKKFSRIVRIDDDDSNSKEEEIAKIPQLKVTFDRKRTDVDMFDDADDDCVSLACQFPESQIKSRETVNSLAAPVSTPTILESPDIQFSSSSIPESQPFSWASTHEPNTQSQFLEPQKKLFNIPDQPVTDEDLLSLCSGKFFTPKISALGDGKPRLTGLISSSAIEKPITDSQILSMCSGRFSTQSGPSPTNFSGNVDESSQDLKLTFDADDDELSLEPANILEKNHKVKVINSDINCPLSSIITSSEDEDKPINITNKKKLLKKRKVVQLVMSDDEDGISDMEEEEEEEIFENDEDEDKFIDYDSEENEVVVVPKKELKKVAANFLENEAELSESEWGSEDEDEKGLDKLELEEGDAEDIDENQMRDQLGKMHARQVLDDDQRDVRMLQEMLFEDGDLHADGAGRERKFKWKNIGKYNFK